LTTPNTSNAGYAEEAPDLLIRYESLPFEQVHAATLDYFPSSPASVLDIGAGTGRDAGYLAAAGHRVVAVEPTRELREPAARLHPSAAIRWVDDSLPDLDSLRADGAAYDLVLIWAVWMHLDTAQRRRAMTIVAELMKPGGRLMMSLRHGPVPPGRRMFDVQPEETIDQAEREGLQLLLRKQTGPLQKINAEADVTWSVLVFERSA